MKRIIDDIAKKYADFEIWRETRYNTGMEDGGDGVRTDTTATLEWAVRVFKDSKAGFSYVSGGSVDTETLMKNLSFSLGNSTADADIQLPSVDLQDGSFHNKDAVTAGSAVLRDMVAAMKESASNKEHVTAVERSSASVEEKTIELYNSSAGLARQKIIKYAAGVVLVVEKDGEEKMEWDFAVDSDHKRINTESVVANAHNRALKLLKPSPVSTGTYAVLLENRAASDLLEVLAPSFVGENIFKKKTILTEGMRFAKGLTVVDDPALDKSSLSYFFDGEGISGRKKMIIRNGAVSGYLLDSFYGKKLNKRTTGNCIRSNPAMPPKNNYSNLLVLPGHPGDIDKAVRERGTVIGIVSLIGMHLVNIVTGEFSIGFEGYVLENGEFKKSVSQCTLSGNLKDIFMNIQAVGDDTAIYGRMGSPSILVSDVVVSGN